jgi:hypothetical protein
MWPGKMSAGFVIRYVLSEFSSVAESNFYVNLKFLDVQRQELVFFFNVSIFYYNQMNNSLCLFHRTFTSKGRVLNSHR